MSPKWWNAFLLLWDKAIGNPDYNKTEWQECQGLIQAAIDDALKEDREIAMAKSQLLLSLREKLAEAQGRCPLCGETMQRYLRRLEFAAETESTEYPADVITIPNPFWCKKCRIILFREMAITYPRKGEYP